jgi:hypothetical protein
MKSRPKKSQNVAQLMNEHQPINLLLLSDLELETTK